MKGITIRVADDAHQLLKAEAAHAGIGLTAYIREAAMARAFVARAHRGYYTGSEPLNEAVRTYLTEGHDPR